MRELAQQAEAIGVDAIFVADQTTFDLPGRWRGFWDGWTLLPALAESTRRVALGADRAASWIDADAPHRRKIDDHAVVHECCLSIGPFCTGR